MTKFKRILAIDGGGIRGIIPVQILVALEQKLKDQADDNARIADYFDLIAGTSTGGILACVYLCPSPADLSRPKFTAEEAAGLYFERGDEIFDIPIWKSISSVGGIADERYPADGLEEAIEDYLGDLELADLLKPCVITAYDIKRRRAMFFTQHDANVKDGANFSLKDVARATSAAPTYFEVARATSKTDVRYPLVDGGVFANNPALCAYAEARNPKTFGGDPGPTAKDMIVLSLGTGEVKKPYYYQEAKDWGYLGWMRPILDIMMSGVSETVDYQLRQIYDAVGVPEQYLRIQPQLQQKNADTDNAEYDNLLDLKGVGEDAADRFDDELDAFAQLLIAK